MKEAVDVLLARLGVKGLIPVELVRLVRDVLNIVRDRQGSYTLEDINWQLEVMGWDHAIMDGFTFEFIKSLMEEERQAVWSLNNKGIDYTANP